MPENSVEASRKRVNTQTPLSPLTIFTPQHNRKNERPNLLPDPQTSPDLNKLATSPVHGLQLHGPTNKGCHRAALADAFDRQLPQGLHPRRRGSKARPDGRHDPRFRKRWSVIEAGRRLRTLFKLPAPPTHSTGRNSLQGEAICISRKFCAG